jgi:hypothetical protein
LTTNQAAITRTVTPAARRQRQLAPLQTGAYASAPERSMTRSTIWRRLRRLQASAPDSRIRDPRWRHRARRLVVAQIIYERIADRIAVRGAANAEGEPRRWLETLARFDRIVCEHEEFLLSPDTADPVAELLRGASS